MSLTVPKLRRSGVRGKTCRNGFVFDAVMSGYLNSIHESTP